MRTEKGYGNGSIYFNKQRKRWNAQFMEYDVDKEGDYRIRTKSFKTEEEAKKFLSTKMYQSENKLYIENHGIPLCEMMKTIQKNKYETNQISATQYNRVLLTIDNIEKKPIGKKKIDEITTDELQEYMNSQKHLSNSSISKIFRQFNQVFKVAYNKGYLMQNPMITVIKPRKQDKVVRALTVDEQQEFIEFLLDTNIYKCKYKNSNVYWIKMW